MRFTNLAEICEIINGRSIYIFGDDINMQFAHTLVQQIASAYQANVSSSDSRPRDEWVMNTHKFGVKDLVIQYKIRTICGSIGQPQHNFHIDMDQEPGLPSGDVERFFTDSMRNAWEETPKPHHMIAILNTGASNDVAAHRNKSNTEQLDLYRRAFTSFRSRFAKVLHSDSVTFYRTIQPGHADCQKFLNSPPLKELPVNFNTVNEKLPVEMRWDLAIDKDAKMKALLHETFPEIVYLDTFSASYLRRDLKYQCAVDNDCFHLAPGSAIEYWPVLFFNALRLHNQLFQE
jgi:hypothetical protein